MTDIGAIVVTSVIVGLFFGLITALALLTWRERIIDRQDARIAALLAAKPGFPLAAGCTDLRACVSHLTTDQAEADTRAQL